MAANMKMTKAELMEVIKNKEQEINTLKGEIQAIEKYERYNDIVDEVASVYNRFRDNEFTREESMEFTLALINSGNIPARVPVRPSYPSYGRYVGC